MIFVPNGRKPREYRLETRQLRLRPYGVEDADHLHRLWTDPKVRRYLWDEGQTPDAPPAHVCHNGSK